MACCLFSAKPLTDPKLPYCQLDPRNKIQWNINRNSYIFIYKNAFENVSKKFVAISLSLNVLNNYILPEILLACDLRALNYYWSS